LVPILNNNIISVESIFLKIISFFSPNHLHGHENAHIIVPFHVIIWKGIEMIVILNNYLLKQGPCGISKSPWQPKIRANNIFIYLFIIIILKGEVSSFLPHKITSLSIVRFLWFFFWFNSGYIMNKSSLAMVHGFTIAPSKKWGTMRLHRPWPKNLSANCFKDGIRLKPNFCRSNVCPKVWRQFGEYFNLYMFGELAQRAYN